MDKESIASSEAKDIICIDFDDVIHSYPGWKPGQSTSSITGSLILGTKEAITKLRIDYKVIILSSRANSPAGLRAIAEWLEVHGIIVDGITATKIPAAIYVDDRALAFEGDWGELLQRIEVFKTWKERI